MSAWFCLPGGQYAYQVLSILHSNTLQFQAYWFLSHGCVTLEVLDAVHLLTTGFCQFIC